MNDYDDFIAARLFERRTVMVAGSLDDQLAGDTDTALMTLDAIGDDPVTLHLDCSLGPLDAAFVVMDTIDLMGVPVRATCVGRLEGPGVGVLAVAHHRAMTPHARVRMCEPTFDYGGSAAELDRWARHHETQLQRFAARLAEATGQPAEHVEADFRVGRFLDARQAVAYGLVDEIATGAAPGRVELA